MSKIYLPNRNLQKFQNGLSWSLLTNEYASLPEVQEPEVDMPSGKIKKTAAIHPDWVSCLVDTFGFQEFYNLQTPTQSAYWDPNTVRKVTRVNLPQMPSDTWYTIDTGNPYLKDGKVQLRMTNTFYGDIYSTGTMYIQAKIYGNPRIEKTQPNLYWYGNFGRQVPNDGKYNYPWINSTIETDYQDNGSMTFVYVPNQDPIYPNYEMYRIYRRVHFPKYIYDSQLYSKWLSYRSYNADFSSEYGTSNLYDYAYMYYSDSYSGWSNYGGNFYVFNGNTAPTWDGLEYSFDLTPSRAYTSLKNAKLHNATEYDAGYILVGSFQISTRRPSVFAITLGEKNNYIANFEHSDGFHPDTVGDMDMFQDLIDLKLVCYGGG